MDGAANEAAGAEVARTLNQLGYTASVRVVDGYFGPYQQTVGDPATGAQIGLWKWRADLPTAQNFFDTELSCAGQNAGLNGSQLCDPAIDRSIAAAEGLEQRDPAGAAAAWAALDRTLVDEAVWIPYSNPQGVDLISQRVGNYQHSPSQALLGNGVLLDELWTH
jgi:ABC-type transport system substrate-binding protein